MNFLPFFFFFFSLSLFLSLSFSLIGIFNVILTYVLQFCSGDNEEQEELLILACHTLQRIARRNNQVNAVILFILCMNSIFVGPN